MAYGGTGNNKAGGGGGQATSDVTINGITYRLDPGSGSWFRFDAGTGGWVASADPNAGAAAHGPYGGGATVPGGSFTGPGLSPLGGGTGQPGGTGQQGGVGPPPAATPPAPTPPDWRTQQSWWGTLFPTGVLQRAAYDLDPNFAWNTLVNHNVTNSASPEYQWLQQQQSRDYALYGDENTRAAGTPQADMTFSDWIEQNASRFHNEFQLQNASVKGYSNPFMQAGRFTG